MPNIEFIDKNRQLKKKELPGNTGQIEDTQEELPPLSGTVCATD